MTTLKQLRQDVELEEGLRHQIIGGATLIAGIMGALGHSGNEADYRAHMKKTYGSESPTVSQIVNHHAQNRK